ncbi:hypothetical protein [Burkholderia pseudomallei]|uniref:hypothetical protein n=1 Tax=Burkholderia pseudomallei TaxID=28450 RepID=UPI000531BFCE|nr:hypothetical protein [Burkholderia pseudomallei]KGS56539.1 hypothetical protein X949_4265 [Burkholderia pseudomallei MSHR5609]
MSTTHNERGAMEARLAEAAQEIAMLKQREQRARAALREMAQRLPSVEKAVYAQILIRAGLMDWIGGR